MNDYDETACRLYATEYKDRTEDVDYYVALAKDVGGPVLELGCGDGRILLPIARAGIEVTGVDSSDEMLGRLQKKLREEPLEVRHRIAMTCADLKDSHKLGWPESRLIIAPFNLLLHFHDPDDIVTLLQSIALLAAPDAILAFDVNILSPGVMTSYGSEMKAGHRVAYIDETPVVSWEEASWDPVRQARQVRYVYQWPDGRTESLDFDLRVYGIPELAAMLHEGGWKIEGIWGSFQGAEVGSETTRVIVQCSLQSGKEE